ncbi:MULTISPECIES: hypothetical protein [Chryseobacterium]|uniref:Bacteriocin n=1 Tax=Chryseobacterium camelliae TaxID=1265445 RepID=A0ABU0TNH2_9FLAO|nr:MULTISPECIES: hypothetical protein [Chryseobacterium]MDT3407552.1 hypothetical protein [Pseudacidovorax intermedius]MDQ1098595.1 hypothetical protein [Chryseobacterium camelliae]MDQ1102519.1 hypothetical protein [Chryseobacterium sp. SORGH_AS_1048]MDR6085953.1 hypothetical protein [Chryseobacterium sp. SORGH_AS_0909]MDR6130319.1 hypothetical protein [Chryseobacterium sp. SORGH_AS_1175]
MKKTNLTKLSRQSLKEISGGGGDLYPALECYSDMECRGHGEALIMCPDGTSSMTNYSCIGGECLLNTGFCNPAEPVPVPGS